MMMIFFLTVPLPHQNLHLANEVVAQVKGDVGHEVGFFEIDPDPAPGHQVKSHSIIRHREGR